jgi:hypothetical protein
MILGSIRSISVLTSLTVHILLFVLMYYFYFGGSKSDIIPKNVIVMEFETPPEIGGEAGKLGESGEVIDDAKKEEKTVKEEDNQKKDEIVTTP